MAHRDSRINHTERNKLFRQCSTSCRRVSQLMELVVLWPVRRHLVRRIASFLSHVELVLLVLLMRILVFICFLQHWLPSR